MLMSLPLFAKSKDFVATACHHVIGQTMAGVCSALSSCVRVPVGVPAEPMSHKWKPMLQALHDVPADLPAGCETNLIQVDDKYPALILNRALFGKVKEFTEDFRRLQQLEKMYAVQLEDANKEIEKCDNELMRLRSQIGLMKDVLDEQIKRPENFEDVLYDEHDVRGAEAKIAELNKDKLKWFYNGQDAFEEMSKVRLRTQRNQYELANLLRQILEPYNLLSTVEQWTQDRRALHTINLMNIHFRANPMSRFKEAQAHVLKDMRATANSEEVEPTNEKLDYAFEDFERCHWNRLVARDEFQRRRGLMDERMEDAPRMRLVDESVWHDAEQYGLREGMRLTRQLIDAERQYRDAFVRLRQLDGGKEMNTEDSSRFSAISTATPSVTSEYVQFLRAKDDFGIAVWRAGVRPSATAESCSTSSEEQTMSTLPASYYDGYSATFFPDALPAKRGRAWEKEKRRRESRAFSRRKRWKSNERADKKASDTGFEPNGLPPMLHLSDWRRGLWPTNAQAVPYIDNEPWLSFSSDGT